MRNIMSLINENRFFMNVLPYIGDRDKIVEELIENSARAQSSNVKIDLTLDKLVTVNDGLILKDWPSLLTVGSTGHTAEVVKSNLPAGMGILMMLSASTSASFHSGNKKMDVDCQLYFDSPEYRLKVENLLNDSDQLIVDDFVDGMRCEFIGKHGFFEHLLEDVYKYTFSAFDRFKYYAIDIDFNGEHFGHHKHDWLVVKNGIDALSGIKFGILNNDLESKRGVVYWHGKEIKCEEIAPFAVVVDGVTSVLRPQLPDRKKISTDPGDLKKLKFQMESLIESDLSNLITTTRNKKEQEIILNAIEYLSTAYDVENFDFWLGSSSELIEIKNVVACTDDDTFGTNGHDSWLMVDVPGVYQIKRKLGETQMPSLLMERYHERINIETVTDEADARYTGSLGDASIVLCSSVLVNDTQLPYWSEDTTVYINLKFLGLDDLEVDLTKKLLEYWCDSESPCGWYDYERDWESIHRAISGEISVREFINNVFALSGRPAGGVKTATVDLENRVVDVKLTNGGTKTIEMKDVALGLFYDPSQLKSA